MYIFTLTGYQIQGVPIKRIFMLKFRMNNLTYVVFSDFYCKTKERLNLIGLSYFNKRNLGINSSCDFHRLKDIEL